MKIPSFSVHSALLLAVGCSSPGGEPPSIEKPEPAEAAIENGSFQAELNGFLIHYEIHGRGPVLMVVPNSWGITVGGLRGIFRGLEERLTLVYFDPRGMGASDPIREESDMGKASVREDFKALKNHLGLDAVSAIGWSNGAMNLVHLAAELAGGMKSAIFLHGSASFTQEEGAAFRSSYPEIFAIYTPLVKYLGDPARSDREKNERLRQCWIEEYFPLICADHDKGRQVSREALGGNTFSWRHVMYGNQDDPIFNNEEKLPLIRARSLIIAGAHDVISLSKAETMKALIPSSKLVIMEDSGHFAPLEEPRRFRDVVYNFLIAD